MDKKSINFEKDSEAIKTRFEGPARIGKGSFITRSIIGKYFGINWNSFVADTHIGSYCTFASRVSVGAFSHPTNWLSIHEFQYRDTFPNFGESIFDSLDSPPISRKITKIGSDVWIGDNAVIRSGVEVGTGVVVGAGTVVTKNLEPYGIYAGNPAKLLRHRFPEKIIVELLELRWWEMSIEQLRGIDFWDIENAIEQLRERVSY